MNKIIYLNKKNEVVKKSEAIKYEKIVYINNRMISREYGRLDNKKGDYTDAESFTNRRRFFDKKE